MTIRPFFKTGENQFKEKESFELEFKPVSGDILHHEGSRYLIKTVEYGASVNGKQTISVFLITPSAQVG